MKNASNEVKQLVLSVVVPVFNEEGSVDNLLERLGSVLKELGVPYEIILIDDGSLDGTWPRIVAAANQDPTIRGISLSRNFGHQGALFAGLSYACGKAIVTMDGDLQHPPETVPKLYRAWCEGYKVVDTRREDSPDTSLFKRLSSKWFYRFFSYFSGLPLAEGESDFRLVDRRVALAMRGMRDRDLFLRGITHWVGFPRTTIPYQAARRFAGHTKFSLFKMLKFSKDAILSFSAKPLRIGVWLGLVTSMLASLELVYIIVQYFRGNTVPGWASVLSVMSLMFGVMFILLGIIGTYLGSIFETLKNRPRFLINETAGFNRSQTQSWTDLIGQSLDEDKCFLHHEQYALERSNETEKTDTFA